MHQTNLILGITASFSGHGVFSSPVLGEFDSPVTYDDGVDVVDTKQYFKGTKYRAPVKKLTMDDVRRWGSDPKLILGCDPKDHRCHNDIIGFQQHKTTKIPLKNPRFDDDHLFQCPKSMIISWTAPNAIDGQGYCRNKVECDAPGRLAHSKRTGATFTADFKNKADHKVEVGRILWWPREDCCQNQYKNQVVHVVDGNGKRTQCFAVQEYTQQRLPTYGSYQGNVLEATSSSDFLPFIYKCPPGTYGTHFTMHNPTYFVMITEIEAYTRASDIPDAPTGEAAGLTKRVQVKKIIRRREKGDYIKIGRSKSAGYVLKDGNLDTYYSGTKTIMAYYKYKLLQPREIHVYPRQDGDWDKFDSSIYSTRGVEIKVGRNYCETDVFADVNPACSWFACKSHPKDCKNWLCRTPADVLKSHVKAGKPIVFKCPAGSKGWYFTIKRNGGGVALSDIEVYE